MSVLAFGLVMARRRPEPKIPGTSRERAPKPGDDDHWGLALARLDKLGHYLDPFLGELKRRSHLSLLERWLGDRPPENLLKTDLFEEAGGADTLLPALAATGAQVVGMDKAFAVVARAKRNDRAGQGWYVAADTRCLPFRSTSLAAVLSPSTLDHFEDPADLGRSLLELCRVLKPTGRLVITLDNRQNLFDPLLRLASRVGLVPYFLGRSYSIHELANELELAGFEVLDRTAILHNPRMVATGAVALANALKLRVLRTLVRSALTWAQRLEGSRCRYWTGSFVAALAAPRKEREETTESFTAS